MRLCYDFVFIKRNTLKKMLVLLKSDRPLSNLGCTFLGHFRFFKVLFMNLLCDASLNINREESFLLVQKLEIFEFIKIK